jgi:hypothetical protein
VEVIHYVLSDDEVDDVLAGEVVTGFSVLAGVDSALEAWPFVWLPLLPLLPEPFA